MGKRLFGHWKEHAGSSEDVTPYMHCMVYHVPAMLKKFGSLRQFSGQGMCKINVYLH